MAGIKWDEVARSRREIARMERRVQRGEVIIDVWNCRCVVSRHVGSSKTGWVVQPASNWEELEAEAEAAVWAQGGAPNISGIYKCPKKLARKAKWEGG